MSLSNLKFSTNYNSYDNDVVNEFYLKALSNGKFYDRVSAYFDSKILALYSTGIEKIYQNKGKIRFIFSQQISEYDFNQMKSGYKKRSEDILLKKFNDSSLDNLDKIKLSNLSFLIEKGVVDIKIAFTKSGILHDKFGLIYDELNNCIFFRGSNNETVAAIESNHESFEVSCSWEDEKLENQKINNARKEFNSMWNNSAYGMMVIEIPKIIKEKLAKYNKGKLILNTNLTYDDCVLADLTDDNLFIVRNNLNNEYDFNKDYDYKNFIKKYVINNDGRIISFRKDINYVIIQKIVDSFNVSASYNNYNFCITKRLRDFINGKNIQIEKRKELGKLIKKRDTLVIKDFTKFKNIVDNEMTRSLRDKQMWDSFFIVKMRKSANYSVPGSGKTSIVYGSFAYLNSMEINKVKKIIMVGPKNSFKSWKDEFYECFGNKKKLKLLNIQDVKYRNQKERTQALRFDSENCNLILVNYDMLPSLSDALKEIINEDVLLVFDEVHKVKAIGGVWANAALNICNNSKYIVVLTGTPIPNSYLDLYNQLNILFKDEYKTFFKFSTSDLKNTNERLADKINESIYPFFCRTTKRELNVPEPNPDIKLICKMNSNEEKLFNYLREKYSKSGLELYIRLLQASTNPKLLLKKINIDDFSNIFVNEEEENDTIEKYSKRNYDGVEDSNIINLINQMNMTTKFWKGINLVEKLVKDGKQVIVWAIFIDTIDKINSELNSRGVLSDVIYGATSLDEREIKIEKFKNKEFNVLVTNPHTLAESVSLHETCHDAVYFEYSFNLTHMLQSRDRINRLGLPSNQYTQYYYLILSSYDPQNDSIDLKTYNRLIEKKNIMLRSIEGEKIESIDFNMIDDLEKILEED